MYSRILVPVDLDEPSSWSKAVPSAFALADAFKASATLCTIVPNTVALVEAQWSQLTLRKLLEVAQAKLALLANDLGRPDMEREVGVGNISRAILEIAEKTGTDLIVLSSHRPEMKDWLIGANADRVVRHAKCSVFVVRE